MTAPGGNRGAPARAPDGVVAWLALAAPKMSDARPKPTLVPRAPSASRRVHPDPRAPRLFDMNRLRGVKWDELARRIARDPITAHAADPDFLADLQRRGRSEKHIVGRIAHNFLDLQGLRIPARHSRGGVIARDPQTLRGSRHRRCVVAGAEERAVRLPAYVVRMEGDIDHVFLGRRLPTRQPHHLSSGPQVDVQPRAIGRNLDAVGSR